MSEKDLTSGMLDDFVRKSDELGVNTTLCNEYWAGLQYRPCSSLDLQVEPFSDGYVQQQMNLYREITGHRYIDARDEFTPGVPMQNLISAPNAYNHPSSEEYAKHLVAIGCLVRELKLKRGSRILELGSGWGVCQELLAACGYETVGIDMNPDFVATSNGRLNRLGFGERVISGTFDQIDFESLGKFDAVLAYEAYHHVIRPLDLLKRVEKCLKPGAFFVLAAEPFNDFYKTWGLRLDPYSIYSIKKFGWFESGWSVGFMFDILGQCGFEAKFQDLGFSELTKYMIGRKSNRRYAYQLGVWNPRIADNTYCDLQSCFIRGEVEFLLKDTGYNQLRVNFTNFNNAPLAVDISIQGRSISQKFEPGTHSVEIFVEYCELEHGGVILKIASEGFSPAARGINSDSRTLGISLNYIEFMMGL